MKIREVKNDFKIIELNEEQGFKIQRDNLKITIYDTEITNELINKNLQKKYERLLYLVASLNDDSDTTESDVFLVRDKIDELRNIILTKYAKYLNKNAINKYLKALILLEEKIIVPKKAKSR